MSETPRLEALDPGIRNTVAMLQSWGCDTTDSGDGVTKPAAGNADALTEPHVFLRPRLPTNALALARAIRSGIESLGITVSPIGQGTVYIQATYDPADNSATVALYGVNDAMIAASQCPNCGSVAWKDGECEWCSGPAELRQARS